MKTHYIIGFNVREAQGYAMKMKEEHRGHQVRVLSVESVERGGLRGLSGEQSEIIVLPRAWQHRSCVTLALQLEACEMSGVTVTSPKDVD